MSLGPRRWVRGGRPRRRGGRSGFRLAAMTLAGLAGVLPTHGGDNRYLDFGTFETWQALVAEAPDVRLCGLTRAGHALWAQGQLRVPLGPRSLAFGVLMPDQELWAVLLAVGDEPSACCGILVLARSGGTWRRLAWQRLALEPGEGPTAVLWDSARGAVLVDTEGRTRLTASATLSWEPGRVVHATPGFVKEVRLVRHVLWWRADSQRFEYETRVTPLEIPDTAEEAR